MEETVSNDHLGKIRSGFLEMGTIPKHGDPERVKRVLAGLERAKRDEGWLSEAGN
ncbi:MAG: hypothetical protein HY556_05090 [Euryarchaeota archaeon]|nr:hypothetical protein [Euryarchaeota archaeon]